MTVRLLPDTETMVVDYYKTHPDVEALIHGNVSADPKPTAATCLTIVLTGGSMAVERHLAAPTIQVDAWAQNRQDARTLAWTAHAAIVEMLGVQGRHGVVTGVQTLIAPRYLGDPKNRPRYSFEIRTWVHPLPTS